MKKNLFGVSLLTISCLYGMLAAIVFLVGILCGADLSLIILISIIIFAIQFLISPWLTDLTMRWFYKAKFDHTMPEYLTSFITEVCQAHKMKYPKIGYIDDGAPNAFTYGRTKNDARIVLTRGIFELLSEDEVKAVVAHELGHAVHYDMLFMTVAQLVPLILYYIFEIFTSNVNDDDESKLVIIGLIAWVFYVISQYVILWLSRTREYYADEYAVETTKNPTALAEALVKIGYGLTAHTTKEAKLSASRPNTLGIMDAKSSKSLIVSSYDDGKVSKQNIKQAMRWEKWNVWSKWYEFFSTHPLISKRLEAISARCAEFSQPAYVTFDEVPAESYVDDFLLELALITMPTFLVVVAVGLIVAAIFTENMLLIDILMFIPAAIIFFMLVRFLRTHRGGDFQEKKVLDLLGEIKVSGVTAVPCTLTGEVIGKGDPGSIFDEDFVLKDNTGIMFIDYKRVLRVMDLISGLTKTKTLFGKKVTIKGWYRRNPVPYVQIYEMEVEGMKKKRFHSYGVSKFFLVLFLLIALAVPAAILFM